MQLTEQYRPATFADVVGQDKAIAPPDSAEHVYRVILELPLQTLAELAEQAGDALRADLDALEGAES